MILILLLIKDCKENKTEYKTINRINNKNKHNRNKSKDKMDKVILMVTRQ